MSAKCALEFTNKLEVYGGIESSNAKKLQCFPVPVVILKQNTISAWSNILPAST